jgi:hypothetical protein
MTKRTGRPSLDPSDPSVRLTIHLPSKRYDAVYHAASATRQTMAEFVRSAVTLALTQTKLPQRDPSR